jgi:VanZ family protein
VVWLGAILTATSLPNTIIPDVGFRFADKSIHFLMYGGLGLLLARAMHNPPRTTRSRVVAAAFLLVVAIGGMDEWHQHYIQGRSAELADWVADSSGGLVGALIWVMTNRHRETRTA